MRQRALLLLCVNGIVLYVFILFRVHYVSDAVHQQTQHAFPGTQSLSLLSEGTNDEYSVKRLAVQVKDLDLNVQRSATDVDGEDTHSDVGDHVQTKREIIIEQANNRLRHVAAKAGVQDPKDLGLEFKNNHHDGRPVYNELVDENGNVTQDVSDLLQFAVVGFGKAGTTTMMDWISNHPKMQCFPEEVLDLMKMNPGGLLAKLYSLPSGSDYQRGYKSPLDVTMPHITQQLASLFPKAKLIIGLRHPVRWFESLYNFRVQNWNLEYHQAPFPPPHDMIGSCRSSTHNTCTAKGEFGIYLRNLGVTATASASKDSPQDDAVAAETIKHVQFEKLMYRAAKMKYLKVTPMPNPIFLFEISQLHEHNETRKQAFQRDVSDFLGLHDNPLAAELPHSTPGRTWDNPAVQALKDAAKIDICQDQYADIRRILLRQSRTTAVWIRHVLLPTGRVQVSSPEYFDQLLDQWMIDPCGPHETTNTAGKKILQVLDIDVETLIPPKTTSTSAIAT